MRFNVRLLNFGDFILPFEDEIRLCKTLIHIANVDVNFSRQIPLRVRIGKINILRFIMQNDRAGFHGIRRVQQ